MAFASPIGSTIAVGRQARLNINGKTICFSKAVPRSTREIVTNQDNTMCNDIDTGINRAQKGRIIVGWSLYFDITWPIVEVVFPLLGVTNTTGVFTLEAADDFATFPVDIDLVGAVHDINNAICAGWAIQGTKGGRPIQMRMDIIGETEDELSGAFAVSNVLFGAEFAFTHSSLTIENDSAADRARGFDRFMLEVNNNPVIEYNNSITMTDAVIGNREVKFATSVPYVPAEKDLYFDHRDANDGRQSVLVLDNDSKILTFTMPAGMSVAKPASAMGKAQQLRTPVTFLLFRDDDGSRIPPLTITPSDP